MRSRRCVKFGSWFIIGEDADAVGAVDGAADDMWSGMIGTPRSEEAGVGDEMLQKVFSGGCAQ